MDIGSAVSREIGIAAEKIGALQDYRISALFSETEKLALAYADHMTETPVEVPEALFEKLRAQFSAAQPCGVNRNHCVGELSSSLQPRFRGRVGELLRGQCVRAARALARRRTREASIEQEQGTRTASYSGDDWSTALFNSNRLLGTQVV